MDKFLMLEEVAQELAVPKKWVLERVREGSLASYRMGHRTIRVRRSDLDRFIEKCFVPTAGEAEPR